MFKIRKGVFETNSSSMHSLVIKKTGRFLTKEEIINLNELEVILIYGLMKILKIRRKKNEKF